jgi:hypothetical protein
VMIAARGVLDDTSDDKNRNSFGGSRLWVFGGSHAIVKGSVEQEFYGVLS